MKMQEHHFYYTIENYSCVCMSTSLRAMNLSVVFTYCQVLPSGNKVYSMSGTYTITKFLYIDPRGPI